MEDIIKLKSGYKEENYLKKLPESDGSGSKTCIPTVRTGESDDGNKFIDPSGGPMIMAGSELEEAEAVVRSTDFVEGYGRTITFE